MSWRSSIPVHDAANLFPLIEDQDELIKIGADIKDHGLISPIGIVVEIGNAILVDGRNRLDAMELVGLKISLIKTTTGAWRLVAKENLTGIEIDINKRIGATVNVVTTDPWDYGVSVNMHRRHLTGEQKREVVAKLLEVNPEKSNRSIAKVAKVDGKTVGAVRRELEATAEIPQLDKRTGKDGKARPAKAKTKKPNPTSINSESYDTHLIGAVDRFAEFCRANSPASVTASILQGEVTQVRVSIAIIREWLGQLVAGLGRAEATDIATKAGHPRSPDVVPPAIHQPVAAASDPWRDLGIPPFLDRARPNDSNPGKEVHAL
jgi:hypothetical protein